jgi:cyclic pyranopterin phosphate synthase
MHDAFGRKVDYLRISVTDRCNMRCQYCMPEAGMHFFEHEHVLTYAEITAFVRDIAVPLGISRLRLTGGEPLVRKDLHVLAGQLAALPGIRDLALTTNGVLLAAQAEALRRAGVTRLNVSLDSLRPERYRHVTRGAELARVWAGLDAAEAAGFAPLKLNCVVMRGFNEDEVADFAALTLDRGWHVRFIEFMPIGDHALYEQVGHVATREVQDRIRERFALEPLAPSEVVGNGPARYWRVPGARGSVGFISQMSHDFCEACNRVRLTSDGKLRHCLLSDHELDVRALLRGGVEPGAIRDAIAADLQLKLERHQGAAGIASNLRTMSQIGG